MDRGPGNPTMFALDASAGKILWSYTSGSSVVAAPAIVGDTVCCAFRLGPCFRRVTNLTMSVSGWCARNVNGQCFHRIGEAQSVGA
jgi:hypothetical protein